MRELIEYLGEKFDAIDRRFDGTDRRFDEQQESTSSALALPARRVDHIETELN